MTKHVFWAGIAVLALTTPLALSAQENAAGSPQSGEDRYEVGKALPPLEEGEQLANKTGGR